MKHISEDLASIRLERLLTAVKKMRSLQRDYYVYHVNSAKSKMLEHQRKVDELIKLEADILKSIQMEIELNDRLRVAVSKEVHY